jgi:hypothetical protein
VQLERRSVGQLWWSGDGRPAQKPMPDEEGGACVQTAEAAERGGVGCGGWVEVGQAGLPAAAVPDLEVDQTSAAGNGTGARHGMRFRSPAPQHTPMHAIAIATTHTPKSQCAMEIKNKQCPFHAGTKKKKTSDTTKQRSAHVVSVTLFTSDL